MRVAIITSRATSLKEVGRGIAHVARKMGHTPVLLEYPPTPVDLRRMARMAIVVMTFNPLLSRSYFLAVRDYNTNGLTSFIYTTVEGRVPRRYVQRWMQRDLAIIANSRYTERRLTEAEIPVIKTVPHGVVMEDVASAARLRQTARKQLEKVLGDGVYFVVVASAQPRKGHDIFAVVVQKVRSECKECKFYILTQPGAMGYYSGLDGVKVDTRFGNLGRIEVLSLIAAADWYVQPSLAEGFGLPVLEAQAVGTPVVHLAYEPLTEHSHPDNIWVPYEQVVYDPMGEGIEYELHTYKTDEFAKALLKAYDMTINKRDDYKALRKKVAEHAKKYDAERVYKELFDSLVETVEIG